MNTTNPSLICTFYLNNTLYGIEIEHVQEVGYLTAIVPVPMAPAAIQGLVNLRGQIITLLDLHEMLALPATKCPQVDSSFKSDVSTNVIVRWNHEVLGLVVDRIGEVIEIDSAKIEKVPSNVKAIQSSSLLGIYTLEDEILHLLNLEALSQILIQ